MAPRATRSSGKIVIKPRTPRTGKGRAAAASTPTRPTIRIGPRTSARRDEPSDDDATVDEDEETEPDDDGHDSVLTSNKGASTSRAQTADEDEDMDVKSEQNDNHQDVDVDGENADEVPTPRDEDEDEEDVAPVPRGRGRGRPRGKGRAALSGTGAPRGRPRGRGKGRPKGRPSGRRRERDEEPEIEIEEAENGEIRQFRRINGQAYYIEGDEYVIEGNPKGETKVDANGNLLGGRQFKSNTFTLPNRHPERKYMLAIDAARTSGFRDSLYYFRRNSLALKLNATQWEKDYLIDEGKLGSHLRTRSVTLITARSAYRLHGAKLVLNGRWIIDDYNEEKILEEISAKGIKPGDYVGELQDPTLAAEAAALGGTSARDSGKQERSGLGLYRAGGPTTIFGGSGWGPYSEGPLNAVKKSMLNREGLNEENWMHVAAQRTLEMDEEWKTLRREVLKAGGGLLAQSRQSEAENGGAGTKRPMDDSMHIDSSKSRLKRQRNDDDVALGVYDPQTGLVLRRADTQPTSARWEYIEGSKSVLGGTKVGNGGWGLAWVSTVMELPIEGEEERMRLDTLRRLMEP